MEPQEMQEFSNQLKEAGEPAERGESLTNISLAISILAVLVAMVTVMGHRTHTEAVLSQSRADDLWNEYQAKKIRFDQTTIAIDLLSLQPSANGGASEKKVAEYKERQEKWKDDLAETQKQAKEFEAEVRHAEAEASHWDLGEALLQVAVVLCSITLFTRRKLYFYLGISIGLVGLLMAITALLVH